MPEELKLERPQATVGVYVTNAAGKILLIRSPKWKNIYVVPGGKMDYGECVADAVIREVKEETGLTVKDPAFLTVIDMIEPPLFTAYRAHFVGIQMRATWADESESVTLDPREASDYLWGDPAELVLRDDVQQQTKQVMQQYFLSGKECAKCVEYKTGWMRAKADYQNLQKEVERRRAEWAQLSEAQILDEFIPVYDNFKKAMNHSAATEGKEDQVAQAKKWQSWRKGVEFIMKQFGDILRAHGIEEIATVGERFNPEQHEAIGEEFTDAYAEGMIMKEIEGGYVMGGKVVKVAKVIVVKKVNV